MEVIFDVFIPKGEEKLITMGFNCFPAVVISGTGAPPRHPAARVKSARVGGRRVIPLLDFVSLVPRTQRALGAIYVRYVPVLISPYPPLWGYP